MQVARLARHLALKPIVVCADVNMDKDREFEPDIDNALRVHRIRMSGNERKFYRHCARIPFLHSIPDEWIAWARRATRWLLRQERINRQDVLVTFAMPMSSHALGLRIKLKTGLAWIAHYSDPWLENPYHSWTLRQKRHFLQIESQMIKHADHLLFTNEETLVAVMAKYPPDLRAKASVMHHYFDPKAYTRPYVPPKTEPYVIRFIGKLYGIRNEVPLAAGLQQLRSRYPEIALRVRFEFVGGTSSRHHDSVARDMIATGLIKMCPPVSNPESLRLMGESAALLSIDGPTQENLFLPSKLVDYLGAKRPVLCVSGQGPSAKLVSQLGGFVASPMQPDSIAQEIVRLVQWLDKHDDRPWLQDSQIAPYSVITLAESFHKLVKSVADQNRARFAAIRACEAPGNLHSAALEPPY